jgi:hypothetical protein
MMNIGRSVLIVALFLLLGTAPSYAAEYYVSPSGSSGNSGSINSPWSLSYALSGAGGRISAGDTVWLRGGTYNGAYTSSLSGTASSPIRVRGYPGEHAKIDGGDTNGGTILKVTGRYVWYWGFEVMSSIGDRIDEDTTCGGSGDCASWPEGRHVPMGNGIETSNSGTRNGQPGLKFINMIIHDTRQGFSLWVESSDAEVYTDQSYTTMDG